MEPPPDQAEFLTGNSFSLILPFQDNDIIEAAAPASLFFSWFYKEN
jgi:hypothetical protein